MNHAFRLIFDTGLHSKLQSEDQLLAALRRVFSLDNSSLAELCSTHRLSLPAGTDQASALEYFSYLQKLGLDVRLESSTELKNEDSKQLTRTQLNILRAEALLQSYPEEPTKQG